MVKGMQDGLAAGIDHGEAGSSLVDVTAYNPSAKADHNSALQTLHDIEFSLLVALTVHKDASVEGIMNLLCLEGPLADVPVMADLKTDQSILSSQFIMLKIMWLLATLLCLLL